MRLKRLTLLALIGFATGLIVNRQDSQSSTETPQATDNGPATASPTPSSTPSPLPLLNLDYATYRAALYDEKADIYTFKNIRYAAPPLGDLRWKKPQPPNNMSEIQDGSVGFTCAQPASKANYSQPISEDCLFLDVYVPGKALSDPSKQLPVVVYVHGGTNTRGAKDQTADFWFNGSGPIKNSNNSIIFVSTNYRLSAFGWLAGDTAEKQGLPNAGLHDQRAAFKWVQKYISLLGGDKNKVTAWGVSAGASDLMHHLVAQGGKLDPLFSKAFLQSPGSPTWVDRRGFLQNCYNSYLAFANCTSGGFDCLRQASTDVLINAASKWDVKAPNCGGLAPDGTYLRQAATLEFATGNYWNKLQSFVLEHASDEPDLFLPKGLVTDADFTSWIEESYSPYAIKAGIINATLKYYPTPSNSTPRYTTQTGRASAWILDAIFAIRVRALVQAYAGKIWLSQYSIPTGNQPSPDHSIHAGDLVPLFWNDAVSDRGMTATPNLVFQVPPNITAISATYQSYMVSHVLTGNPNTYAASSNALYPAIEWPQPGNLTSEQLTGVLNFGSQSISTIADSEMLKSNANFAQNVVVSVTNLGGYAVPGTVLTSTLAAKPVKGKAALAAASKNYVDQCSECRET